MRYPTCRCVLLSLLWVSAASAQASPEATLQEGTPSASTETAAPPAANEPSPEDKALARELGVQGFELVDAGQYEQAAERFARALALYDAATLRLAHARSLMKLGRLVAAAEELRLLLRQKPSPDEPESFARARTTAHGELDTLLPRLSQLTIELSGMDRQPASGWTVEVDGNAWSTQALGVARPFDPGTHTVLARAADGRTVERQVTLAEGSAEHVVLELPVAEPVAPPTPPASKTHPAEPLSPPDEESDNRVLLAGLATVALTVGAVVTGFVALSKRSEFDDKNRADVPQRTKQDSRDSARTWAWINTGLSAAAVAGAGLTFYYWNDDPTDPTDAAAWGAQWSTRW